MTSHAEESTRTLPRRRHRPVWFECDTCEGPAFELESGEYDVNGGTFDYVELSATCPHCGANVDHSEPASPGPRSRG